MKIETFIKNFFTSKKLIMKDILLYVYWVVLGIIILSTFWSFIGGTVTGYWGFSTYVNYLLHAIYEIIIARIAFEVLIALFDIHESLKKK